METAVAGGEARAREFPLAEARQIVRDLMTPEPRIYWLDFGLTIALAWAAFALALWLPAFSAGHLLVVAVAGFAFYRAAIFIHELAHLKKGSFRAFRLVWNLVCGIPLLAPSFTYDGVHNEHHKRDIYGTGPDGEYLPFVQQGRWGIIAYMALPPVLPAFFIVRFLVLAPLSWLSPWVRRKVWTHASSLAIDLGYERPEGALRNDTNWRWQELAAFALAAAVAAATLSGGLSWEVVALWYAIGVLLFFVNSLRTLAAHAYRNPPDRTMTVAGQYLDSVNVPGWPVLTSLWAPVGLRYHATHHLFPAMPYHNLEEAHRRLASQLGETTLYLEASRRSLWDALRRLWHEAAEAEAEARVVA